MLALVSTGSASPHRILVQVWTEWQKIMTYLKSESPNESSDKWRRCRTEGCSDTPLTRREPCLITKPRALGYNDPVPPAEEMKPNQSLFARGWRPSLWPTPFWRYHCFPFMLVLGVTSEDYQNDTSGQTSLLLFVRQGMIPLSFVEKGRRVKTDHAVYY